MKLFQKFKSLLKVFPQSLKCLKYVEKGFLRNNYMFKVKDRNTGKRCEICSELAAEMDAEMDAKILS